MDALDREILSLLQEQQQTTAEVERRLGTSTRSSMHARTTTAASVRRSS
jgi:DNA-binding Lrp family transcriptional regulator